MYGGRVVIRDGLNKTKGEGEWKGIKGVCEVGKGNIRENREGGGERRREVKGW